MAYIDDSTFAAAPLRSAKPNARSQGAPDDGRAKSSFEDAVTVAARKQLPSIAPDNRAEKPVTSLEAKEDGNPSEVTLSAKAGGHAQRVDLRQPTQENLRSANSSKAEGGTELLQVTNTVAKPLSALTTEEPLRPDQPTITTSIAANDKKSTGETQQTPASLIAAGKIRVPLQLQGAGSNTGKAATDDVGRNAPADISGLQKTLRTTRHDRTDSVAVENAPNEASGKDSAAEINQLLTMLGGTPSQVQGTTSAPANPARAASAFPALAERVGKAGSTPKIESDAAAGDTPKITSRGAKTASGGDPSVKETETSAADRTFRFARADGKGQAVSMSLGADGERTVSVGDKPGARAEAVTVLEARRYLGLSTSTNSAAVTNAIAASPQLAAALAQTSAVNDPLTQAAEGKVLNTLKIQLHPLDLGTVTATLRLKDDELQVDLKVESGEAFRQLSDDQNGMIKALRAQGFAVDQINIVFNAGDTTGGNAASQQGQAQSGPQGRDAAPGGSGQGRNQQDADRGQRFDRGEGWTGNDTTVDAPAAASLGRPGDVYM